MIDDDAGQPAAPCQDALPRRHRCRSLRRPDGPGSLRRGLRRRRRGQPVPLGVRLDLHRAVRGGLPARHARRADRDPDPQAVRRRARHAPAGRPAGDRAAPSGSRSSAAGRPGMSAAYYLVAARLRRHGLRGDARPRRHDGHRHPGVPPAARDPAGRDRPHRRRSASSSGSTPRWAATSRWATSSSRASGPSSSRPARRKSRRLGVPGDQLPRGHPGHGLPQATSTWASTPRLAGAGGRGRRRQHGDGCRAVRPAQRRRIVTVLYRRGFAEMPAQAEEVEAAGPRASRSGSGRS